MVRRQRIDARFDIGEVLPEKSPPYLCRGASDQASARPYWDEAAGSCDVPSSKDGASRYCGLSTKRPAKTALRYSEVYGEAGEQAISVSCRDDERLIHRNDPD